MKLSKKILSAVCAMALVGCMGTTAFAAGSEANADGVNIDSVVGNNTQDVTVGLKATLAKAAEEYSVNVKWTNMQFDYTEESRDWNPQTHSDDITNGKWSNEGKGTITVTNNSNVQVDVEAAYASESNYQDGVEYQGVTVDVSGDCIDSGKQTLNVNGQGTDTTTISVGVSGTPADDITEVDAGKITVTIKAVLI